MKQPTEQRLQYLYQLSNKATRNKKNGFKVPDLSQTDLELIESTQASIGRFGHSDFNPLTHMAILFNLLWSDAIVLYFYDEVSRCFIFETIIGDIYLSQERLALGGMVIFKCKRQGHGPKYFSNFLKEIYTWGCGFFTDPSLPKLATVDDNLIFSPTIQERVTEWYLPYGKMPVMLAYLIEEFGWEQLEVRLNNFIETFCPSDFAERQYTLQALSLFLDSQTQVNLSQVITVD